MTMLCINRKQRNQIYKYNDPSEFKQTENSARDSKNMHQVIIQYMSKISTAKKMTPRDPKSH